MQIGAGIGRGGGYGIRMLEASREVTRTADIELDTKEGDTVTISSAAMEAFSRSMAETATGSGSRSESRETRITAAMKSVRVEGNLSPQETEDIRRFLEKVDTAMEELDGGNLMAALETLTENGMNRGESISGYKVALTRTESVDVAFMEAGRRAPLGAGQALSGTDSGPKALMDAVERLFEEREEAKASLQSKLLEGVMESLTEMQKRWAEEKKEDVLAVV